MINSISNRDGYGGWISSAQNTTGRVQVSNRNCVLACSLVVKRVNFSANETYEHNIPGFFYVLNNGTVHNMLITDHFYIIY